MAAVHRCPRVTVGHEQVVLVGPHLVGHPHLSRFNNVLYITSHLLFRATPVQESLGHELALDRVHILLLADDLNLALLCHFTLLGLHLGWFGAGA